LSNWRGDQDTERQGGGEERSYIHLNAGNKPTYTHYTSLARIPGLTAPLVVC
jgi:hypothetical protein